MMLYQNDWRYLAKCIKCFKKKNVHTIVSAVEKWKKKPQPTPPITKQTNKQTNKQRLLLQVLFT